MQRLTHDSTRFRRALVVVVGLVAVSFVAVALVPVPVVANTNTRLVLHALPADPLNDCFTADDAGFECTPSSPATVGVTATTAVDIYLYVRDFDDMCGLQCALNWDSTWQFTGWGPFATSACLSSGLVAHTPVGPGATDGTLAVAFDRLLGGFPTVVGFVSFTTGVAGCVDLVESSFPSGTHVVDCQGNGAPVDPSRRGRVCVGAGGIDACNDVDAVEPATWAAIKAAYAPGRRTGALSPDPSPAP